MADHDSDDAFLSADEETSKADSTPSSSNSAGKLSRSPSSATSSSSKAAAKKEPQTSGKSNTKKSKAKKGKKKQASAQDEKEATKEISKPVSPDVEASTEESTIPSQDETGKQVLSTEEEQQKEPSEEEAKTNTFEDSDPQPTDNNAIQPSAANESLVETLENKDVPSENVKDKDEKSPSREDIHPECDQQKDADDKQMKTDPEDFQKEAEVPQADKDTLLESGNQIDRNIQEVSSDKDDETVVRTGDDAKNGASGETGEKSMAGALGRLTGEKPAEKKASGGGWGWGGWGSSLVSSVSAVGHSLSSVIENVETSLGVPKPETLTEQELKEQQFVVTSGGEEDGKKDEETGDEEIKKDGDKQDQDDDAKQQAEGDTIEGQTEVPADSSVKGFLSFGASAITSVVGKTVTGGLDALETIGRKTMDVLQEGDIGAGKRKKNAGEKGNLSEMLRDAKKEAETAALQEDEERERQRAHFGILFDQYQGLAHLEALEMISNQSESRVQGLLSTLKGDELQSVKTELIEIRDAFQLEDLESEDQPEGSEQDFVNAITEHLFGVTVASTPDKLQQVQKAAHEWLAKCKSQQEDGQKQELKELHIKAMETLAEFTSRVIEQFHKASELMLLPQDKEQDKSSVQRATSLSKLTSVLAAEVSNLANSLGECLNREATNQAEENSEDVNPLITNIYLEASNSTSYIQDAFQLVLPVLQMVTIERTQEATSETTS